MDLMYVLFLEWIHKSAGIMELVEDNTVVHIKLYEPAETGAVHYSYLICMDSE